MSEPIVLTASKKRRLSSTGTGAWSARVTAGIGWAAAASLLLGCQPALPLPELKALALGRPLVPEALRLQVDELDHPLLPPLALDLSDGMSPDEAALVALLRLRTF